MTLVHRLVRSDRGAEIIELALVTPLLLLLLGAIVDFGFLFRSWGVLTNAAREGARVGILPAYQCVPGPTGDVEPRVQAYLSANGIAGATVEVAQGTVTGFTSCNVRVSMSQPMSTLGIFGRFFGDGFTAIPLAAGAAMRMEVQGP